MNKYASSIKYGLLAGIIASILYYLVYFVSKNTLSSQVMIVLYIPILFLMIWGGISVRRERGGFGGFGNAFLAVFIISISATIVFDTSKLILFKVVDPGLSAFIKDKVIEETTAKMEKAGASDEQIEKQTEMLKTINFTGTKMLVLGYAASFAIGAFLSLLIALFVSRGDEFPPINAGG
jgi:hypothetical protein